MRRSNIRIEQRPASSSPQAVGKIREALRLDRDIKGDRSHRTFTPRKQRDQETPRVLVVKSHHNGDVVEILRRAHERAPLTYNRHHIAFFPDYELHIRMKKRSSSPLKRPWNLSRTLFYQQTRKNEGSGCLHLDDHIRNHFLC